MCFAEEAVMTGFEIGRKLGELVAAIRWPGRFRKHSKEKESWPVTPGVQKFMDEIGASLTRNLNRRVLEEQAQESTKALDPAAPTPPAAPRQ
jgi:hypothetical protein